jgi:hypothetical protein
MFYWSTDWREPKGYGGYARQSFLLGQLELCGAEEHAAVVVAVVVMWAAGTVEGMQRDAKGEESR